MVEASETPQTEPVSKPCRLTAVVADDHVVARTRIREILEDLGIEVVAAVSNGDHLLDAAQRLRPQFVTVDIRMPGLNGLSATQLLKRKYPETRFFVVTNYPNERYRQRNLTSGVRDQKKGRRLLPHPFYPSP